ncbi:hypothetical protein LCGC14_2436470, partial [marine sediment metagenome]
KNGERLYRNLSTELPQSTVRVAVAMIVEEHRPNT